MKNQLQQESYPERPDPGGNEWEDHHADHLSRYLYAAPLVAGRRVLDAGTGPGYGAALLKDAGASHVQAVDIDPATIGGALFTLQVGLASPSLVGIVPSIEMVIYAAVGGRLSLIGAVYGAILVGAAKTYFSENFVEYWLYFIGGLFMLVVIFLPEGLAGLLDRLKGGRGARGEAPK